MSALLVDYPHKIEALLRELGVPANYASIRELTLQVEATEFANVGPDDSGRTCQLTPRAAEAWRTMRVRAREHDIELTPLSGFRSVDRQAEIIRGKLALGEAIGDILRAIAAPGYSEHHTGRAIDIGTPGVLPLEEDFANTRAYAWLGRHATRYGFSLSYPRGNRHGFIYEPWHWCWQA